MITNNNPPGSLFIFVPSCWQLSVSPIILLCYLLSSLNFKLAFNLLNLISNIIFESHISLISVLSRAIVPVNTGDAWT